MRMTETRASDRHNLSLFERGPDGLALSGALRESATTATQILSEGFNAVHRPLTSDCIHLFGGASSGPSGAMTEFGVFKTIGYGVNSVGTRATTRFIQRRPMPSNAAETMATHRRNRTMCFRRGRHHVLLTANFAVGAQLGLPKISAQRSPQRN